MVKTIGKCEACNQSEVQWELVDNYNRNIRYHVCSNCHLYLAMNSLPPLIFKNLILNGHSPFEYLLHGDFYDEEGNALQPR